MTRRKAKKQLRDVAANRKERIEKLLTAGWIKSAAEIPPDAIPVHPDRINVGGSYFHPVCYQAIEFTCLDCGKSQTWEAKDQLWYYETTGAFYLSGAIRCRACRKKEQERKRSARKLAGHE